MDEASERYDRAFEESARDLGIEVVGPRPADLSTYAMPRKGKYDLIEVVFQAMHHVRVLESSPNAVDDATGLTHRELALGARQVARAAALEIAAMHSRSAGDDILKDCAHHVMDDGRESRMSNAVQLLREAELIEQLRIDAGERDDKPHNHLLRDRRIP